MKIRIMFNLTVQAVIYFKIIFTSIRLLQQCVETEAFGKLILKAIIREQNSDMAITLENSVSRSGDWYFSVISPSPTISVLGLLSTCRGFFSEHDSVHVQIFCNPQ